MTFVLTGGPRIGTHALAYSRSRSPLPPDVVANCALGLAVLYAIITPLHFWVVTEEHARVIAVVAGVTVVGLLWSWWHMSHGRVHNLRLLTVAVAAAPIVNCLVHIAATGSTDETPQLMLTIVAIGATLTSLRNAAGLVLGAVVGWGVVVALRVDGDVSHAPVQLLLAAVTAMTLYVVRMRSEQVLGDSREALSAEGQATSAAAAGQAESELRFREIFARSPVGIALTDEDGRFVTVNDALLALLGRPEHEVIGRSSVSFTDPDDVAAHDAAPELIGVPTQPLARVEQRYVRPDGSVRWAWLTVTHTHGPSGQQWTLAHVQDVTERRQAEQLILDSERNLTAVTRVTHRIQAGEDVRSTIVNSAMQLAHASAVLLFEPDHAEGLVVTDWAGLDVEGVRIPLGHTSATVDTFHTGTPMFVADVYASAVVSSVLREATGARSALFQPVHWQNQTVAVIVVAWMDPVAALSDRVAGAVALLADEMAVALSQEAMRSELRQTAQTDALTGLPNRREWDIRLDAALAHARRSGEPVVAALADLDRFKRLNDTYGHAAGDEHLRSFAQDARGSLREVDVLARWGGEEFAVAMPGCAEDVADLVLAKVRAAVPGAETVSIGWATWDGYETADELMQRVDVALYAAKAAGRDRVMSAA